MVSSLSPLEILGLHNDTHSHEDEHYAEGKDYLWRILGIIAGIYGFFLIERILSFLVPSHGHVSFAAFILVIKQILKPWGVKGKAMLIFFIYPEVEVLQFSMNKQVCAESEPLQS